MSRSDKTWHIVPPDEMRCIWMAAGIISYQLCDREFECDECPLDAAIRNHLPRHNPARQENGSNAASPEKEGLRDDRSYSRNHCWMKQISSGLVQMGIEPGLSAALLTPKAVVFPSAGQRIFRGQIGLWIVTEGGTLPVESPLDGIVRSTNHQLAGDPHLLSRRPLDKGWLLEMEVETPALEEAGLISREQAEAKYRADQDKFLVLLQNAVSGGRHPAGVTLADGGQRLRNLVDVVGPDRYLVLLRKAFS